MCMYVCMYRKCCRMLSYDMVCGVGGFRRNVIPIVTITPYGFSLSRGRFSQNTRRHLLREVRARGV